MSGERIRAHLQRLNMLAEPGIGDPREALEKVPLILDAFDRAIEGLGEAAFPLGVPVGIIANPDPKVIAKWLNQELKDRSDAARNKLYEVMEMLEKV